MKKLLLGCAIALCGMPTAVSAQDFCCPVNDCCFGEFEGLYVGGNVGVFSNTAHRNDFDGFLFDGDRAGWSSIDTNVSAGVILGYDMQWNGKLVGIVADWNWVNTRHDFQGLTDAGISTDGNHRHNWFTTIRARTGVTVCDALLYVTGGAAVHRTSIDWDNGVDAFDEHRTQWGWVGGFGTEYLLGCNWSVGLEFLFLQFSEHNHSFTTVGGDTFDFGHSDSSWIGRFTLNYRFGDLCGCFF